MQEKSYFLSALQPIVYHRNSGIIITFASNGKNLTFANNVETKLQEVVYLTQTANYPIS